MSVARKACQQLIKLEDPHPTMSSLVALRSEPSLRPLRISAHFSFSGAFTEPISVTGCRWDVDESKGSAGGGARVRKLRLNVNARTSAPMK